MTADPDAAARRLRQCLGSRAPRLAIILGTGLGGLAERLEDPVALDYAELDGFARSTVAGHAGRFVAGRLEGHDVLCLQGRVHVYEGHPPGAVLPFVRTLKRLDIATLLATNAAGSLRRDLRPGRLMAIADHINLQPSPLIGPNDPQVGPRFPSLRDAYAPRLRLALQASAAALGIALAEGVYLAVTGPTYETPAEVRAFRSLGADVVGMSTVPEIIAARHCGLACAAISVVTNMGEGLDDGDLAHDHVLDVAAAAARDLDRLIRHAVPELTRA